MDVARIGRAVLVLVTTLVVALWTTYAHAEQPAEAERILPFKVVSYNVWGVPHITPDREERIAGIAEQLAKLDADFVALQEVWLQEDADVLSEQLARAGLVHQRFFGPAVARPKGSGLWIASRYPLEQVEFVPFEVGHKMFIPWHVDWLAQKGIAIARVNTPMGTVQLANTHLQAAYAVADYANVKVAQALQVGALLRPQNPEASASPLILMGDINALPHSLPFQVMTERAALAPAAHVDVDAVLSRSGNEVEIAAVTVQELFTEPVQVNADLKRTLSDHACLVVDFSLRRCEGCAAPVPYKWREVAAHVVQRFQDERGDTERVAWAARVLCVLLPLVALFLFWRIARRRTSRRALSALAAVALMVVGYWLGYVGWDFAPYEMDMLSAQAAELERG